jgi:hypothetical protein
MCDEMVWASRPLKLSSTRSRSESESKVGIIRQNLALFDRQTLIAFILVRRLHPNSIIFPSRRHVSSQTDAVDHFPRSKNLKSLLLDQNCLNFKKHYIPQRTGFGRNLFFQNI